MIKRLTHWVTMIVAATLMACGGGGGSSLYGGGGGTPPPTGPTVASVDVISSQPEVQSGGAQVTITAIVKGAGNVSLSNAAVQFSTDTGTISEADVTTDAAGVATAKLSGGNDRTNRTATVTVTAGATNGSVSVDIVGTEISVSGPTTLQLNGTAALGVAVTDGSGSPVANVAVTPTSTLGNLPATAVTTNAQGQATFSYTGANPGTDSVQFSAAGAVTAPQQIIVSGQDFTFVSPAPNAQIAVGASQPLTVRFRVNGVPQAGVTVNFTSTAGQLTASSTPTDAAGLATVSISATTASPATVQASITSPSASATLPIEFVATTPAQLVLQVTPTALAPNASGSTTNQAQVLARVTDLNGNPVKNQTVNFSRDADPSGGNLSQPSAVTDSSGQATVQYIAGATSTASDGIVVRGTVAGSGVTDTATLTVSQSALFIALGTGNTIQNIDEQTYKKDYTVYVTDANGVAVPNVTLTIKALPQRYGKGRLAYNGKVWKAVEVAQGAGAVDVNGDLLAGQYITCGNEDRTFGDADVRSYNGTLDAGEDFNSNARLEPGNVISVSPGTLRTDTTGRGTLSLIYAESYAPWVEIALQVQATVSGTASTTRSVFFVSGSAADFSDEKVAPAGVDSPFGFKPTCAMPG